MPSPLQPLILFPIDYRTQGRGPFCHRWYKEQCTCVELCQDLDTAQLVMIPAPTLRLLLHEPKNEHPPKQGKKERRGRKKDYGDYKIFYAKLVDVIKAVWLECLADGGEEPTIGLIVASKRWKKTISRRTFEQRIKDFQIDLPALIDLHKP